MFVIVKLLVLVIRYSHVLVTLNVHVINNVLLYQELLILVHVINSVLVFQTALVIPNVLVTQFADVILMYVIA